MAAVAVLFLPLAPTKPCESGGYSVASPIFRKPIGNLRSSPFNVLWNSTEMKTVRELRNEQLPCHSCEYRDHCEVCPGEVLEPDLHDDFASINAMSDRTSILGGESLMFQLKPGVSYRLLRWLDLPGLLLHLHPDSEWLIRGFWAEVFDMVFRKGIELEAIYRINRESIPVAMQDLKDHFERFMDDLAQLGVLGEA